MTTLLQHICTRHDGDTGRFSRDFALADKSSGIAYYSDSTAEPNKVDERNQISWWRISTMCMDREGDILVPSGCLDTIKSYTDNPVVCFNHKREYPLPIGTSVGTRGGPFDVNENDIVAGCKHHSETQFADEVCRLTMKGILRGCSISFVPLAGEKIRHKSHEDSGTYQPRYKIKKWNMTEWSVCSVGVNPEAVRIELSMGSIKSPELLKSLTPLAQAPKIWANGADFKDEEAMIDFETVDKSTVAGIRFHKSHFADQEACLKWLAEKSLDSSLVTENAKSWDYAQGADEASEKTDKIADGCYIVYSEKAFPPTQPDQKKKKPKSGVKPGEDRPMKPTAPAQGGDKPAAGKKPADAAKPGDDEFPPEKGEDGEQADDEVDEDGNPLENGEPKADDVDPAQTPAQAANTPGTMTYSARSFVDILKHKAAEAAYLQQELGMHDHDGLTALMQEELKISQERYSKWLQAAQGSFPDLNFAQLTSLESQDDDLDDSADMSDKKNSDNLKNASNLKSLSDDELDEVLVGLALMDLS
jgi:hypothetical protein